MCQTTSLIINLVSGCCIRVHNACVLYRAPEAPPRRVISPAPRPAPHPAHLYFKTSQQKMNILMEQDRRDLHPADKISILIAEALASIDRTSVCEQTPRHNGLSTIRRFSYESDRGKLCCLRARMSSVSFIRLLINTLCRRRCKQVINTFVGAPAADDIEHRVLRNA